MDYLRATSDDEMGKTGPSPAGCGENLRHTFVVILDGGPATAFGFRLVWHDFPPQPHPRESA